MTVNRGISRGLVPKITWGAAFANTLVFAQPLDDALSYGEPVEALIEPAKNGDADGWVLGTGLQREYLRGIVHRIPRVATAGITGWEGATGWDAFLAWAREPNAFRFFPNAASGTFRLSYLEAPIDEGHNEEITRHRSIELIIAAADDLPFTGY